MIDKNFTNMIVTVPPRSECQVCVIVPVRDEADLLASCLMALLHQVDDQGKRLDPNHYEVILFANNCSDHSAAIARQFSRQHPELALHVVEKTLAPAEAYIGYVRKLLMDIAYQRLISINRKRGIIASTDGDTRVSSNWIAATQTEIARGADAVGGQIMTDRDSLAMLSPQVRVWHWRNLYYYHLRVKLEDCIDADPFDCWPRHQQNYGASLAVTAEMYHQAGGMPAVKTPEDVAFCQVLVRMNARLRHSTQVRVTTSARQTGRTAVGFANQLAQWAASESSALLVESLDAIETRLQARRKIRHLWQRMLSGYQIKIEDVISLANAMCISAEWLLSELTQARTFNWLVELVEQEQKREGRWERRWALVDIEQAIADLRCRTYALRQEQLFSLSCKVLDETVEYKGNRT